MGTLRGLADWVLTREVGGWTLPDLLDHAHQKLDVKTVTLTLSAGTAGLLAYWLWNAQQELTVWERLGVPGPKPNIFMGNGGQMRKMGFCDSFVNWNKMYGKVYGIYSLKVPTLVVGDPEMLREITTKNFSLFTNRMPQPILDFKPWKDTLLQLRDDNWKHVRSQLSPTFSSGKLKKMTPAIAHVLQNFIKYVDSKAKTGENVELRGVASCFTMDTIAAAAFGMQVDSLSNPKHPFNVNGLDMLNQRTWLAVIFIIFPWMGYWLQRLFGISFISIKAVNFFLDSVDQALAERRKDSKTQGDFLQLLVEAEREGAIGPVDKEIDHADHLTTSNQWKRLSGMNDDEIRSNALLFLIAGYDSVSTVLSFTLFYLAGNPEVLRKAQQEVDSKIGKNPVTYESAGELTYLDMCMNESMRLFPPGFILDREAGQDCVIRGYTLTKGTKVIIPVYAIHRDPDFWPDPERFDPERHTPEARAERHPFAFLPFGQGPRNCIGMRLAQLEIRMAIASLLQRFTITLTDKSVYPPVLKHPQAQIKTKDGLWVKFTPRE